ncbi:MAG: holo-ACP synthase [Oscillospiraceae bacterium]|nr:holo-ACP synthase [Oscillospiraceae bacterium]MBR5979275.1 holo-ACP synthase [Oscillospiraceae bacterium]
MIYGIGVDMTEISRVSKACSKESFLRKVFSGKEAELYADKPEKLAAGFAAKEAFSKALGTGVRGFSMREVELFRDDLGKPYYVFSGRAESIVKEKALKAHVSVTDEGDLVTVFTVLETD